MVDTEAFSPLRRLEATFTATLAAENVSSRVSNRRLDVFGHSSLQNSTNNLRKHELSSLFKAVVLRLPFRLKSLATPTYFLLRSIGVFRM